MQVKCMQVYFEQLASALQKSLKESSSVAWSGSGGGAQLPEEEEVLLRSLGFEDLKISPRSAEVGTAPNTSSGSLCNRPHSLSAEATLGQKA